MLPSDRVSFFAKAKIRNRPFLIQCLPLGLTEGFTGCFFAVFNWMTKAGDTVTPSPEGLVICLG